MIEYKYSILYDIVWMLKTIKNIGWLKKKGLKVFYPNFFRIIKLCFNRPVGPKVEAKNKIFCYWISSGTWGSYAPPNKIFICPWEIGKAGGLKRVIEHEIVHLEHESEIQKMNLNHEEKEKFINRKQKRN